MTITLLTATPGCGKTNHAVWSIIKPAVESGRVVYVNRIPDLKLPHIKLSDKQLNRWHERTYLDPEEPEGKSKLDTILEGSLIVVDEAMYPWPAIDLRDPPEHIKYLSQHRKHGLDFLIITQSPKFVHRMYWKMPTGIFTCAMNGQARKAMNGRNTAKVRRLKPMSLLVFPAKQTAFATATRRNV